MTKLQSQNIASASAIPNGSIIKKASATNFAPVVKADLTALGIDASGVSIVDA